jgi:lipopolysaccharide biosynthesis glycosyltransferase
MNFIYCLDKNYNIQALMSFFSLNKVTSEKINIYIAHNQPSSLNKEINKYEFENLNFKFLEIKNNFDLPNLHNSHVTEATYYRIFAINLIKDDIDHIVYIDSDILFNKDPYFTFHQYLNRLKKSEYIICANTIGEYETDELSTIEYFDYMEMNDKYFNAGVIIYDLKKYFNNDIGNKLEKHLINFQKEAKYWDQDILNTFFNGKYLELPQTLNNNVVVEDKDIKIEDVLDNITVHFAGKTKPWHVKGLKYPIGCFFQKQYQEIFDKSYFISPFNKTRHLKETLEFLKKSNQYCVDNYLKFLFISLSKIFKS